MKELQLEVPSKFLYTNSMKNKESLLTETELTNLAELLSEELTIDIRLMSINGLLTIERDWLIERSNVISDLIFKILTNDEVSEIIYNRQGTLFDLRDEEGKLIKKGIYNYRDIKKDKDREFLKNFKK